MSKEKGYKYDWVFCRVKNQRWPDLEKTVADIIGVQPMEIWPSRYKADDSLVGYGIRKKRSAELQKEWRTPAVAAAVALPRFCDAFFHQNINPTLKTQPQPRVTK